MRIDLHLAILRVISYFHFFKYPVTRTEVFRYLPVPAGKKTFNSALAVLLSETLVYEIDGFLTLSDEAALVSRRLEGNAYAQKQLKKANRIGRFLGNFPFVESVYVSGSLSKDFSLPDGDIDFFIITSPNRLWIARSIMHIFKKFTFLFNAQHNFCMNYYLGMEKLELDVKNVYTAIELATLKPVYIRRGAEEILNSNAAWMQHYLPNHLRTDFINNQDKKWLFTAFVEKAINVLNGEKINKRMYEFTRRKWIRKWERKKYNIEKCLDCMDLYFNAPVNYPQDLMQIILDGFENIYSEIEKKATECLHSKHVTTSLIK